MVSPNSKLDLVAVVPVFNEEANISSVLTEWILTFKALGLKFILLVVDDGSNDGTPDIVARLAGEYPGEVIHLRKFNSGHGRSCRVGYDKAISMETGWVLQIDSDGQCDPAFFPRLWAARQEMEAVFGRRTSRGDGLARIILSKGCQAATRWVTGAKVIDPNVPYRLIRREVLQAALTRVPADFNIQNVALSVVLARTPGLKIARIPIHFRDRQGGTNSINLRKVLLMGAEMLKALKTIQ